MEIYKLNENIGQILDRRTDGDVDVDFGGTTLTLPESDNEYHSTQKFDDGGVTGSKEITLNPCLLGRKIKLKIPTGEVRDGQFAIVELGDIKASHNEKTFQNTEGYPLDAKGENINDRNYQADVNAQNKVREFAMDLQPDRLITTGVTPSGTPIINVDGIVVSGNNRTMSLKLTTRDYRDKYDDYVNYLKDECEAFGFTYNPSPNIIIFSDSSGKKLPFHKPVLVRIDYDIPALNTLELSKYNKDTKKSERPIDKALKLGKILQSNDRCKENIGQIVGNYETFSDFYASTSEQKRLMELLIQCNILTTQEQPMYFDGANFTSQGKELIESLLTGLVLDKEAVLDLDQNVRKWRSMIITSLPVLSANGTLGEGSLLDEISQAISLEAKIVKSGLSFADWIIQGNMFDEKPNPEILYLNRLLSAGRNTFKDAIEKYNASSRNEQGGSMFGDTLTHKQIFEGQIVSRIPKDEIKMIEQTQPKDSMKLTDFANQMGIEVTDMTPDDVTLEVTPEPKSTNPYIEGNWFKQHPDKILAKIELGTNWRDGSQINIYKGGIDALTKIDVSYSFLNTINNNPLISVMNTNVSDLTIKDQGAIDNITNAINKSAKDVRKKRQRKSEIKDLSKGEATASNQTLETLSLFEVYNMKMDAKGTTLNQQISQDELRAFLWHQDSINRTIKNPEWYQLAGVSLHDLLAGTKDDSPNTLLRKWIDKGIVFYDGKGLVPAYLYLSGNVYEKYNRLVTSADVENSGQDAEYIISKYGQKVYDNQLLAMRKLFDEKRNKALAIEGTDKQAGLSIVPSSKFSKSFMIKTLADELPIKWKKVTASTDKRFGQMDFMNKVSEYDRVEFPELSLRDAFGYWLVNDSTISVKKGITYAEIIKYYILMMQRPRSTADPDTPEGKAQIKKDEADHLRLVAKAKDQGDKLFAEFLKFQLLPEDKIRLEYEWNMKYNNNVPIDTNKIPVAFRMNKFCGGQPTDIRAEKREAVAFTLSNGSGLLAYDVGVGKTPSAIMTISAFLDMGFCKRPLVIVPNQTYKQWLGEFKDWCGHIPINAMYNLNDSLVEEFQDSQGVTKKLPEGSVTIMTYEGLANLGYSQGMSDMLSNEIYDILVQDTSDKSEKQKDKMALQIETKSNELIGKALAKSKINVDELGFDYVCLDEAHACKKVFTNVAGESEENTGTKQDAKSKPKVQYKIQSGAPSSRGIKGFILCYYIQKNNFGNTQLLTATPFTNSPLEVFSMLAMVSYTRLKQDGLNNINTFFDLFVQISYEIVINAQLNPERKQVILGFNNLLVLQQLVREFILHKTGESVGVVRPQKWVLPLTKKKVGDLYVPLSAKEQITTSLQLSPEQKEYMAQIREYAEGRLDIDTLSASAFYEKLFAVKPSTKKSSDDGVELSASSMSDEEKIGVRLLRALNFARSVALSPYLYKFNTLDTPTPESYVRTSAKLTYVVETIKTIKEHHQRTNTPMSGVVIYMERGVQLFDLLREYIITNLGFKPHEVGIISAETKVPVEKGITSEEAKEYVKNLFNGEKFNKGTGLVETLPDDQRLKILIGSATIKEGMNLQKYSSTLFNCFLSFNPTDIQQLEGRIYRQKNAFKNVRIVNPLLVDSADIFMFQKLEEKTSRINSVFETDGHTNVLKTEEFNPGELKYALVKDPLVIAKMELIEEVEKLADDITDINNAIKKMDLIADFKRDYEKKLPELEKMITLLRPKLKNRPLEDQLKALQQVSKNKLDADGKYMRTSEQKRYAREGYSWADKVPKGLEESPIDLPNLYFVASMLSDYRSFKKIEREYFIPRNISVDNIKEHTAHLETELELLKKAEQDINKKENIERKVIAVREKQEALHIRPKELNEVVREFESLNYLLDDVKLPSVTPKVVAQCPPVDANGVPRIDPEGLKLLDECCAKFPDTRAQNVVQIQNANGDMIEVYTPERQKLHDKIVKHLIGKAKCVKKEDPIAVLMGGAPGSGKSYYLRNNAPYLQSDFIWSIDADEVRAFLPEYKGWNSSATHQETKDIVNQMLDSFDVPCKHDLLYDGTMTNPAKYEPLIGRLKKLGYKVFMIFMDIPKEKSIERALKRYQENGGHEAEYGRYVPISVIEEFYRTGDEGYQRLKGQADGYVKVESLSGKVVDRGGMQLPADREYMKGLGEPGKPEVTTKPVTKTLEVKKENVTLEKLKKYVSGAKASLPYLTGDKKATMERYIKGLESTIKYL